MARISTLISWVFMPLLMPVYALLLVLYVPSNQDFFFNQDCMYTMPPEAKQAVISMFVVFCVLAPGISFLELRRRKIISSLEMDEQAERMYPILIMLMYCLVLYLLFLYKISSNLVPKYIFALPLSGVLVTAVFAFVNRWYKLSIHAAAAGILSGFILAYLLAQTQYELWVLILSLVVSGVIMSARLYLKKHTLLEVLLGWGTGCFLTFVVNYLY